MSDMFPVNSYVLLKPPDGARAKLQMPKAGPFIVAGISADKYSIQDLLTHKIYLPTYPELTMELSDW